MKIVTHIFSLFLLLASIQIGWSQTRLVLNGAKINIANGATLVIENPAINAITRIDGYIISEGENNLLKWMIGTTTGTYMVPWGKGPSNYIPLSFTKTAGSGSGFFLFSGYTTPSLNSSQLPTAVTNFTGASGSDKSLFATDRFWQINAQSYTAKPSLSNLTFTYLDTEFASPNITSTESSLTAQRWNSVLSSWLDYAPSSIANTTANTVTLASVDASDFYPWWVVNYIDDRHWVAATSSTGGLVSDWSYTTGGSSGAALPTTLDAVLFEDTNSSSITLGAPMLMSSLSVSDGYTGVITQGANIISTTGAATFSGGTFTGGSADITVGGAFSLLGTTFTSTTALLDLKNNFTFNSGIFNHNNGTVRFSGTTTQDASGTLVTNFKNIEVTNATANPGVRIQSNQNLNGILTLSSNAVVDADGSNNTSVFKLISLGDSPTLDGAINILPTGAQITGNVTVQRFMTKEGPNNNRIYRYISSPVQNASVADIQSEIPVTGPFTGSSICSGCATSQSMFSYNESVITGDLNAGYINFPSSSNTETLAPGKGYSLFVRANILSSTLWDVRAPINAGNVTAISLPVSFTSSGMLANDGWNLVGNPFPSTIDWNAASGWTKTNLDGSIYVPDNGSASSLQYATWNGSTGTNGGSRNIALGQGYWVKAIGGGTPSLQANENVKVAGTQTTFFREGSIDNLLRITMKQGGIRDETVIHFRDDATSGFDHQADAWKLKNGTFNLSSIAASNEQLAINSWSALQCNTTIKLNVTDGSAGSYTLSFTNLDSFDAASGIQLIDLFLNQSIAVTNNLEYAFEITTDQRSLGSERFQLLFDKPSSPLVVQFTNGALTIDKQENIQWYFNDQLIVGATGASIIPEASGIYSVMATNNGCELKGSFEFILTAVGELLPDGLSIFPNPASDEVFILSGQQSIESATLVNSIGQVVNEVRLTGIKGDHQRSFTVKDLNPGVYLLYISTNKDLFIRKLIKN